MPRADAPASGAAESSAAVRVVVWQLGGALLAVRLEHVVEVAAVDPDGRAVTRAGRLELHRPRGLPAPEAASGRAVVVSVADRTLAIPAESIEGVRECEAGAVEAPPPWLRRLTTAGFAAVVRLDDRRFAALLDPAGLPDPS